MKKFILLLFFAFLFNADAFAHEAFKLLSSEKKIIKESDLANLEKSQSAGKKDKNNLTFTEKEIRLVVLTGPEDDMLSYRVQGVRNPNLIVPSGATLKILFVNADVDMRHDIRFGHVEGEFAAAPEIAGTAGSQKLAAKGEDGSLQAEEIVVRASEDGAYKYFCSVRGHAKGGMWSNILVGVKPGENLKTAPKTKHVHSPDEDKEEAPTKPGEQKKPTAEMPEMNHRHDDKTTNAKTPETETSAKTHQHNSPEMRSSVNVGDPMSRESSGTAWVPDSTPLHAYMKTFGDGGMLMLHGTMFGRYTSIGSRRDVSVAGKGSRSRFDAPSMFMAMYSRPVNNKSQIGLRAMVSLDPIIQRGYGYPLLYQSAETFRGEPLHDRQHPHDFISELSASYSYKFNEKSSAYIYAGYPGEPALGPPMFMHRASGMNNPDSPISHHWQDSTHIAYGVLTTGFVYDRVKFEVSAFNGTEPDENRWAFDSPKLNSFSGRLSFNPTGKWSLQISHGYLKNPERAEPEIRILRRTTASAIYNKKFTNDRNFAASVIWGQNHTDEGRTNSYLFEADYQFQKNSIFGRVESVEKSGHELVLDHDDEHKIFRVGAFSIGYLREIYRGRGLDLGIGAMATFNVNPSSLVPYYGGTKHQGWQFFFRIRPSAMKH